MSTASTSHADNTRILLRRPTPIVQDTMLAPSRVRRSKRTTTQRRSGPEKNRVALLARSRGQGRDFNQCLTPRTEQCVVTSVLSFSLQISVCLLASLHNMAGVSRRQQARRVQPRPPALLQPRAVPHLLVQQPTQRGPHAACGLLKFGGRNLLGGTRRAFPSCQRCWDDR